MMDHDAKEKMHDGMASVVFVVVAAAAVVVVAQRKIALTAAALAPATALVAAVGFVDSETGSAAVVDIADIADIAADAVVEFDY